MESFDQSLKYLLQHHTSEFIRFGLGEPSVCVIEPVSSALPSRGRDIDGAYLIMRSSSAEGGDKRIVHVEMHRRHQAVEELGVDVAEAQIRLFRRERLQVISLVWDLYGDANAPVLEKRTLSYGEAGSCCVYQRVNLRGMSAAELLGEGPPGLWSLVALTRDGASETVVAQACSAIEERTEWTSAERADHLAVLWFVAEAEQVPVKVLQSYLSEGRLMESELYRSIFEKGEEKGEAKAYAEMLIRLLIHRLGTVAPALRERLRSTLDVETLRTWCDEAMFASDIEGIRGLVERIQKA